MNILGTIGAGAIIFLEIIQYFVIFDVILSWLALAGVRFRPRFISQILDPIYSWVRKYIPSNFWAFDFTPIIVIFASIFLSNLILSLFPDVGLILSNITQR
jgi:uncharacterized protein YggT (Ycf19 family)